MLPKKIRMDTDKRNTDIYKDIGYIRARIDDVSKMMDEVRSQFVTKAELQPIKLVVYGLVAVSLSTLIGAILLLVLKGN